MQLNHIASVAPVKTLAASNPLPFAAVPSALIRDPRLNNSDRALAALLIDILRGRCSAEISNARMAAVLRLSERTIRACLRRLEAAEWFRCTGDGRRTKRKITALWLTAEGRFRPAVASASSRQETTLLRGADSPPEPDAANKLKALLPSLEDTDLTDGDRQARATIAARLLVDVLLDDPGSHAGHAENCQKVIRGEITAGDLWSAVEITLKALEEDRQIDNPAAYCMGVVKNIARGTTHAGMDVLLEEEREIQGLRGAG
jgi:hypothetical protein